MLGVCRCQRPECSAFCLVESRAERAVTRWHSRDGGMYFPYGKYSLPHGCFYNNLGRLFEFFCGWNASDYLYSSRRYRCHAQAAGQVRFFGSPRFSSGGQSSAVRALYCSGTGFRRDRLSRQCGTGHVVAGKRRCYCRGENDSPDQLPGHGRAGARHRKFSQAIHDVLTPCRASGNFFCLMQNGCRQAQGPVFPGLVFTGTCRPRPRCAGH